MALSAFDDKTHEPRKKELAAVLGGTAALWSQVVAGTRSRFDPLTEEWVFSGKKWGWALRLKQKKRAILYLTPCEGFFYAGLALGEKAVAAALASDLPASVLEVIDGSRKYAEGRAVRLEIRSKGDAESAVLLAELKR